MQITVRPLKVPSRCHLQTLNPDKVEKWDMKGENVQMSDIRKQDRRRVKKKVQ